MALQAHRDKSNRMLSFELVDDYACARLEIRLYWRGGLHDCWHISPGGQFDFDLRCFPDLQYPSFHWTGARPVCRIAIGQSVEYRDRNSEYTQRPLQTAVVPGQGILVMGFGDFRIEAGLVRFEDSPAPRLLLQNHFVGLLATGLCCLLAFPLVSRALKRAAVNRETSTLRQPPPPERPVTTVHGLGSDSTEPTLLYRGDIKTFLERRKDEQRAEKLRAYGLDRYQVAPLDTAFYTPQIGELLDAAFSGESVSEAALVDAYLTLDVGHYNRQKNEADRAVKRDILQRLTVHGAGEAHLSWRERIGRIKASINGEPTQVYNARFAAVSDRLLNARGNCQAGSVATILSVLLAPDLPASVRPVFVHSAGHVQPGLIQNDVLYVVEATARGADVGSMSLSKLGSVGVTDARLELLAMVARMSTRHDFWSSPLADELFLVKAHGAQVDSALDPVRKTMSGMAAGITGPPVPAGDRPMSASSEPLRFKRPEHRRPIKDLRRQPEVRDHRLFGSQNEVLDISEAFASAVEPEVASLRSRYRIETRLSDDTGQRVSTPIELNRSIADCGHASRRIKDGVLLLRRRGGSWRQFVVARDDLGNDALTRCVSNIVSEAILDEAASVVTIEVLRHPAP